MPQNREKRTFVAIPLPSSLKGQLGAWIGNNRGKLAFRKWIHPQDIHITLQFLGSTTKEQMVRVILALKDVSKNQSPFSLCLQGVGTFGKAEKPTILWAGVGGEKDRLHAIQKKVTSSLVPIGFPTENRPYHPHVTLARTYKETYFPPFLEDPWRPLNSEWLIDRMVLYESKLGKDPMYHPVSEFLFGKDK